MNSIVLSQRKKAKTALKKLKHKKAAGTDRIRNEMIKSGRPFLMTSLKKLFDLILEAGTFLDCCSMGLITLIFKSGEKSNPTNYRGICVTSCLGNLFTALLNTRPQFRQKSEFITSLTNWIPRGISNNRS